MSGTRDEPIYKNAAPPAVGGELRRFSVVLVSVLLLSIAAIAGVGARADAVEAYAGPSGLSPGGPESLLPPDAPLETEPALLRVTTNPPVAGKILVDGVARDEYGLAWLKIEPGAHTVAFSDLSGVPAPHPLLLPPARRRAGFPEAGRRTTAGGWGAKRPVARTPFRSAKSPDTSLPPTRSSTCGPARRRSSSPATLEATMRLGPTPPP